MHLREKHAIGVNVTAGHCTVNQATFWVVRQRSAQACEDDGRQLFELL